MRKIDPKEFGIHLRSLLLCCCSPLSGAVETLMKAHRFHQPLEIGGHENPGFRLFVNMAKRLDVEAQEVEVKSNERRVQYLWLSDHSTPNQRVWIPDMQNRVGDFHVLFPFFFRYHLTELRKHEPDYPSPKVDNLYVLLLWHLCFRLGGVPISARILKDLLAWEKTRVLTAYNYAHPVGDEKVIVSNKVSNLKQLAQLYMGFWTGRDAWDLVRGSDLASHPINERSRMFLRVVQPDIGQPVRYPFLVNHYIWDVEQLGIITKNVWALDKYTLSDTAKSRQCLILRAKGTGEDGIQEELGFKTAKDYYEWQVKNFLDVKAGRLGDVYKMWLKACEYFDLEPRKELLDQVLSSHATNEDSEASEPTKDSEQPPNKSQSPGLVYSPDYRSIKLPSGQSFTLTDKQSQVVSILHVNLEQGTPELSSAWMIEEVYPGVAETRLRRLFNNNEAYDTIIEPGSKKGTVRLNPSLH